MNHRGTEAQREITEPSTHRILPTDHADIADGFFEVVRTSRLLGLAEAVSRSGFSPQRRKGREEVVAAVIRRWTDAVG